ncbi:MAG TPA: thioredoxin family protein [Clostridia bacterium]|nr:thioredoxin family protein [Clostridia bacterium]
MSLLNEEVRGQLSEVFEGMGNEVTIALFTKEDNCETCSDTKSFMEEVSTLSEQLNLEAYDLEEDSEKAEAYNVDKVPAIVLLNADKKYQGVKFYGIPAGHEINSFVTGIMEVSGSGEDLPEDLLEQIKSIDKDVDIKVFVTLSCPHCPGAVAKAHKLALLNDKISGEMIEAQTFGELSQKFNVSGVPKIVINDEFELVGNQPLDKFLEEIGKIN